MILLIIYISLNEYLRVGMKIPLINLENLNK